MKAAWKDIEYLAEAGKYHFQNGDLLIEPRHLEIWNEFPNAIFVVRTAPAFSGVRYVLGGYDYPKSTEQGAARPGGSSNAPLCGDLASLADRRVDSRDSLRRGIAHH
jgi:hypothetical protein